MKNRTLGVKCTGVLFFCLFCGNYMKTIDLEAGSGITIKPEREEDGL